MNPLFEEKLQVVNVGLPAFAEAIRTAGGTAAQVEWAPPGEGDPQVARRLAGLIVRRLPEGPLMFPPEQVTDRSQNFRISEIIREKLTLELNEELPYGIAVEIEKFETEGKLRRIHAAVIVDKAGHKGIVIGKGGEKLKRIASEARVELERLFDGKVFLEVWVKVKSGWADDERALKSLGYE